MSRLKLLRCWKIELNTLLKTEPHLRKEIIKERKKINKELQQILYGKKQI